ncbi:MAG TPA: OmpA family protein [Methylotenera sp.]|nr:OmpA family protein [Methylotenera sp.]
MKITTKNITLLATIAGAFTLASCTNNSALIVPDGAKRVPINQAENQVKVIPTISATSNNPFMQMQAEVATMQEKIAQLEAQLTQNKLAQSRLQNMSKSEITSVIATMPESTKPPELTEATLLASTLFAFNQTALLESGKAALRSFATSVKSMNNVKAISVVGYADKLGSAAYNHALSTKRADVVRAYLQFENNLSYLQFTSLGKGSLVSSATTQGCGNRLGRQTLIDCLSPDRRVEINVY